MQPVLTIQSSPSSSFTAGTSIIRDGCAGPFGHTSTGARFIHSGA